MVKCSRKSKVEGKADVKCESLEDTISLSGRNQAAKKTLDTEGKGALSRSP